MAKILQTTMTFRVEEVCPELACEYLSRNMKNRKKKDSKIRQMVSDILANRWKITHQGIAFDESGSLIDGQNRLHAIIISGRTVPVLVVRGVPVDSVSGLDTGTPRSVADIATIAGDDRVTNNQVATARQMKTGISLARTTYSAQEMLAFMEEHEEALSFVHGLFKSTKGVGQSSVRAVIARAWYTSDRQRLEHFAKCLQSGFYDNRSEDEGAIVLRNFLLSGRQGMDSSVQHTIYAKTERALRAFLDKQPILRLYEVKEEMFPIPGKFVPAEADEEVNGLCCIAR